MERLIVIIFLAAIIGLPILAVRYARARSDRSCLRKLDQRVKNELLTLGESSSISREVMAMVKGHILRSHGLTLLIAEVLFIGFSLLGGGGIYFILVALPLIATAVSAAVKLHRLSDEAMLIKVKAFVFRKGNWGISAAYYDMQRLEYRVFTQASLFEDIGSSVAAGKYVYLIVRRAERGHHVIRILSF